MTDRNPEGRMPAGKAEEPLPEGLTGGATPAGSPAKPEKPELLELLAPAGSPAKPEKPELLAPAGNPEKLRAALRFGADAVYLAGDRFGLRAGAGNFTLAEMAEGIAYAHRLGKKVYLAVNLLAHAGDVADLPAYLDQALDLGPDACIVADPGIVSLIRANWPRMPIHLSTQANTTNHLSARFWHDVGVKRIVLARELSLAEMGLMRANTPQTLELEAFVHGAMCMAYSGRCFMSLTMTGRDANRGDCAQPCRWSYRISEARRDGEVFPVEQDERGTYLYNSRDLCLIRHLPALMAAGIGSFKIEGRMKSAFYAATVVKAYREAIDAAWAGTWDEADLVRWDRELASVSNRGFTTGFLFGQPGETAQRTDRGGYDRTADFVAVVPEDAVCEPVAVQTAEGCTVPGWRVRLEQRNHFRQTDKLECLCPIGPAVPLEVLDMRDEAGVGIDAAPHPQMPVFAVLSAPVPAGAMIRRPCL